MKRLIILLLCLALPTAWAGPVDWAKDLEKCPADLFAPTGAQGYTSGVRAQCEAPSGKRACMAACASGKGEYCYWAAIALQATVAETDKEPEVLFQRACKLGIASGCTNRAAGMMPEPPATVSTQSCQARTFARTCAENDAWGCAMYGLILSKDKSDPLNRDRAVEALKKACRFDEEDPACESATSLLKELQK